MDYFSYFGQKVVVLFWIICLQHWKLSPVVNTVILLVNQTKEIWRDFTRFAIISKPKIQITQNKNPMETNYITYHIIVNFLQNWHTAFSEKIKAGHFWKFCSRVLEINFGRDSRVSKIAFTEKILHTLHDFQLPAYQCEPDRHSTQSQTTLFRPTIQNAVIPSI